MTGESDSSSLGGAFPISGDLDPGTVLEGRYRIIRALGEGGVGVVYEAEHVRLGRTVAIKVLRENLAISAVRKRFDREAKALASLSHPNIVAISDYGVASHGVPYLVMELLEGRTLREVLDANGRLPDERCLQIVRQILAGLVCAHQAGIIHRDLKPGNVFLVKEGTADETVKILDFGFVKVTAGPDTSGANLSQQGLAFGTIGYMPPEQVTGGETGPYSDVYAVGVVLYEMLTGHKPFSGGLVEIAQAHLSAPVPPLSHHCPGVDPRPELERCLERAMAKRPEDRYPDAAALLEAIEAIPLPLLPPKPVAFAATVPAIPVLEVSRAVEAVKRRDRDHAQAQRAARAARRARRTRLIAAAVALVALALVGLAAWDLGWLSTWLQPDQPRATAAAPDPARPDPARPDPAPPDPAGPEPAGPEPAGPEPAGSDAGAAVAAADAAASDAPAAEAPEAGARDAAVEAGSGPGNPWTRSNAPRALALARRQVLRGRVLGVRQVREVRDLARANRGDPRPHLVLAQSAANDGSVSSAMERYELAYRVDATARGDPRMLADLIALVDSETVGDRAADLIERAYGQEAREALDRALARSRLGPRGRRRLEVLRERIGRE